MSSIVIRACLVCKFQPGVPLLRHVVCPEFVLAKRRLARVDRNERCGGVVFRGIPALMTHLQHTTQHGTTRHDARRDETRRHTRNAAYYRHSTGGMHHTRENRSIYVNAYYRKVHSLCEPGVGEGCLRLCGERPVFELWL